MAQKAIKLLGTVAAIDHGITELKGIVGNVNERVQVLACSIIAHDIEHGDCTRALKLVNTLPNSFRREYLIRFFQYFGAIGIDVKAQKVRHLDPNSKNYHAPDIDAAKVYNWYEPFDANGDKQPWYEGPNPAVFEPNTFANFGDNITKFADRTRKQLTATRDNGRGVEVPVYALSDEQMHEAENALLVLERLGVGIMAGEKIAELTPLVGMRDKITELVNEGVEETDETAEQAGEPLNEVAA